MTNRISRLILRHLALAFIAMALGCSLGGGGKKSSGSSAYTYSNLHSLTFDGTASQYLTIGQPPDLAFDPKANEFTISAWFRATSATSSGVIISKSAQLAADRQVQISIAGAKTAEAFVGGVYRSGGPDVVTDGLWHHVAVVNRDIAGVYTFQLYVDGVAAGTAAASGAATNVHDWLIGARRHADNTDIGFLMSGEIDEVAIWNSPLDITEIAAQVTSPTLNLAIDSGAYVSSLHLVSWWRMGDRADSPTTTVYDQIGSNDATPTNLTTGSKTTNVP